MWCVADLTDEYIEKMEDVLENARCCGFATPAIEERMLGKALSRERRGRRVRRCG
jgi:hypothetical protein